jgi:hypothetical protein
MYKFEEVGMMGQHEINGKNGEGNFALARTSTGPRTAQGKERSKRNAQKHGIFSKGIVLEGESQAEYDALLEGLRADFQPIGTFENTLVEDLATIIWRLRRLRIAEGAEIRAGIEFIEQDEKQRQFVEATEIFSSAAPVLMKEKKNPEVLARCLGILHEVRHSIQEDDFDVDHDEPLLAMLYGPSEEDHCENTLLDCYLRLFEAASVSDDIREEGKYLSPETYKDQFLEKLSAEENRLLRYQKEQTLVQAKRMKLESFRRLVPDSPRLDRLLKCQAALERSLDRALSHLERAQRTRLGQPVAPRIDVNLSSS